MVLTTLFYADTQIHHEFCESELWHHRIEVLNVITSILMVYFPIVSIMKKNPNRNYLPEDIMIFVGIGSALFHYNNTFLTALFDEVSMLLFVCVLANKTFYNGHVRSLNILVCMSIMLMKLGGMSSVTFSHLFGMYAVGFSLYALYRGVFPLSLCVKMALIAIIRQVTEDYCLEIPIIFSLIGHPLWHILISKYAIESADYAHRYSLVEDRPY